VVTWKEGAFILSSIDDASRFPKNDTIMFGKRPRGNPRCCFSECLFILSVQVKSWIASSVARLPIYIKQV